MASPVFAKDLYNGKVVFVTGGGSGICYGMTQSLMAHGCDAAILGRRSDVIERSAKELEKATGRKCLGFAGDVRKPESLKEAVEKVVKAFGRIDFVILGAAGNFLSPISGMSENAFRTVIEIDTLGSFNTIKATIAEVKKTKGAYLAVSATLHYRATVLQAHVSAAKSAVDSLIAVVAVEYGPHGVRANVVAPGPIDGTEGIGRLIPKDVSEAAKRKIPLQRNGSIQDIANTALFLFSPAASYISAATIVVDGGHWHNSSTNDALPYPESFLDEDVDVRKAIASKL